MNEIEKRVEEIVDGINLPSYKLKHIKKELTDYITGLLDKVVPRDSNTASEWGDGYRNCYDKIKQNIAKLKGESV